MTLVYRSSADRANGDVAAKASSTQTIGLFQQEVAVVDLATKSPGHERARKCSKN